MNIQFTDEQLGWYAKGGSPVGYDHSEVIRSLASECIKLRSSMNFMRECECDAHKRSFCFYCKHQSVEIVEHGNGYMARCACCDYHSRTYDSKEEAYSAHNRVADKCMLGEMRKFRKKMERKAKKMAHDIMNGEEI